MLIVILTHSSTDWISLIPSFVRWWHVSSECLLDWSPISSLCVISYGCNLRKYLTNVLCKILWAQECPRRARKGHPQVTCAPLQIWMGVKAGISVTLHASVNGSASGNHGETYMTRNSADGWGVLGEKPDLFGQLARTSCVIGGQMSRSTPSSSQENQTPPAHQA